MLAKSLYFFNIFLVLIVLVFTGVYYKKIWFLYFNIFVAFIIFLTLIIYNFCFKDKKIFDRKFKIVIFILFVLQITNTIFNFYIYFFDFKIKTKKFKLNKIVSHKENLNLSTIQRSSVIKGKIYGFVNKKVVPLKDAKLILLNITRNDEIAVFYSDFDGAFEYKIDNFISQDEYMLKILHAKFKTYTTKVNLISGGISELEIFLSN